MKMAGTRTVIFIPAVTKSSNPWMVRGGANWDVSQAGVFYFWRYTGSGNIERSFRSVLSRLNYGLKIVKKYFFLNTNRGY